MANLKWYTVYVHTTLVQKSVNSMLADMYTLGVSQYIAIDEEFISYRNMSRIFFLLIKLLIFHWILVLKQLQVQKVYTCHIYTFIKGLHTVLYECI